MTNKLKISQVLVEQERSVFEPGRPGELPKQTVQTFLVPLKPSAHPNLRFLNMILDGVILFGTEAIISIPLLFVQGMIGLSEDSVGWLIFYWLLAYYIGFEYFFQATPGKMITGCKVINEYGERPSLKQIIARTAVRFVPFDAFSFLGQTSRGWHDEWPATYVVHKKDLPTIMEAKKAQEEEFLNKKE